MKFIACTFNGNNVSIMVKNIQAVTEGVQDRKGKAIINMARLSNEVDDDFHVDQTYREVLMMLSGID